MCLCSRKKKQQKAASGNVQSKKEPSSLAPYKENNSQRGGGKDATLKETAIPSSNQINQPHHDGAAAAAAAEKLAKEEASRKEKALDELEGPYAAPGPANILPKFDQAEMKEASDIFPLASLKKDVISNDRSAALMSQENTLKEVPRRMPETDIVHDKDSLAQTFTNDQLL